MPRLCPVDPLFEAVVDEQDGVVHRDQAVRHGLTRTALTYRLRSAQWQVLLPDVYLTRAGEPSRRQMLIAAVLFAGSDAAVDGASACRFHGITSVPDDDGQVFVVVPWGSAVRSRKFVIVRRTNAPIRCVSTRVVRYVDPATAVIAATRRMRNERAVLAALSEVLQRRLATYDDLVRAHVEGPPRNSRLADDALEHLGAGTRSAPEADFRRLVRASPLLPTPEFNVWLRLSSGRVVCVDALFRSSAVVHETNGRSAHVREDRFEDMQERHDALTAEGFTVLHNSPRRLRLRGREVVAEVERCHVRFDSRGLPPGVVEVAMAG